MAIEIEKPIVGNANWGIQVNNAIEKLAETAVYFTYAVPTQGIGHVGNIAITSNYLYVCVSEGLWKKVALQDF